MTGVVWNSVTLHVGSPSSGTLGPGHGAFRQVGARPVSGPAPPALGRQFPGGVGLCGPRTDLLTFGQHVGQGREVMGVDEGDVKPGLHGGLIKAREGFPGIGRLHLGRGQHPAQTRC